MKKRGVQTPWQRWGTGDTRNGRCVRCNAATVVKRKPLGRTWLCEQCFEANPKGER